MFFKRPGNNSTLYIENEYKFKHFYLIKNTIFMVYFTNKS